MANVLLRRAAQIVNRINTEAAFEVEQNDEDYPYGRRRKKKVVTLNATATFSIDASLTRINNLRHEFDGRFDRMFTLMDIGTRIRQDIAKVQGWSGVSAFVTERVMVVRKITVITHLLEQIGHPYNEEEVQSQFNSARERARVSGNALVDITVTLLNAEDRIKLQYTLKSLRRRLIEIDDNLAELNATNHINISDEDMTILGQHGIV